MTATTCPHCGSPIWIQYGTEHDPLGVSTTYECGDSVRVRGGQAFAMDGSASFPHGPACRLIRALRVSQLKRMERRADDILVSLHRFLVSPQRSSRCIHKARRMADFRDACRRELDRLRGQG